MQVMIAKPQMQAFLSENIAKHEIKPTNEYIKKEYKHNLFNIKVYNSGIMTICGEKKNDIYKTLITMTNEENTIGSDEVGVGDFFGPTIYCTTQITKDNIDYISNRKITIKDSKKLKDTEIIELYEDHIKNKINYEYLCVFDCDIPKGLNSIEQKSYYHNKLINKFTKQRYQVLDLYTTENNFWKVSKKLDLSWPKDLIIETKADSKYYTVALASIIARYHFIKEMNKLNEKYNYNFPYGANVTTQAQEVANLLGKDEMAKFVKTSFKTFNNLK